MELVSLTVAGLVLLPGQMVHQNDEYLVDQKVGIIIKCPSGWKFLPKSEHGLIEVPGDEEAVVCILVKDDNSLYDPKTLAPVIIVYGIETVFKNETLKTLERFGLVLRQEFDFTSLPGFRKLTESTCDISGCAATEYTAIFSHQPEGFPDPVNTGMARLHVVPNNFSYGIDVLFFHALGDGADRAYRQLRNTIRLA